MGWQFRDRAVRLNADQWQRVCAVLDDASLDDPEFETLSHAIRDQAADRVNRRAPRQTSQALADVGVGDEVAVLGTSGIGDSGILISVVERATKAHVVVNGRKWRRKDGRPAGKYDPWSRALIRRVTDDDRVNIQHRVLVDVIRNAVRDNRVLDIDIEDLRLAATALANGGES